MSNHDRHQEVVGSKWWGEPFNVTLHTYNYKYTPRALFFYIFLTLPSVNQKKISHTPQHTYLSFTLLTIMQLKIYVSAAHLTAYMNVNHSHTTTTTTTTTISIHTHAHVYTPPSTQFNQPTFEGNSSLPTQKRKIMFGVMCIWCFEKQQHHPQDE